MKEKEKEKEKEGKKEKDYTNSPRSLYLYGGAGFLFPNLNQQ